MVKLQQFSSSSSSWGGEDPISIAVPDVIWSQTSNSKQNHTIREASDVGNADASNLGVTEAQKESAHWFLDQATVNILPAGKAHNESAENQREIKQHGWGSGRINEMVIIYLADIYY